MSSQPRDRLGSRVLPPRDTGRDRTGALPTPHEPADPAAAPLQPEPVGRPVQETRPAGGRRLALALAALSCLAAAAPLLLAAATFQHAGIEVFHRGDQALIASRTAAAGDLHQSLGAYSRYGWSHPGPAWFGLLALPFRAFGSGDAGLVVASVLVHALMAVLLVAATADRTRPSRAPLVALAVLAYLWRMPASSFVDIWNPYAQLLPTALFVVLAARACAGSVPAGVGALVVGGYLVQCHVGAAVLVLGVGAAVAAVLLARLALRRRQRRREPLAPRDHLLRVGGARGALLTALATAALVGMWWPVLLQQRTAPVGQGNLANLVHFFRTGGSGQQPAGHSLHEAVVTVGTLLAVPLRQVGFGPFEMDLSAAAEPERLLADYGLACLLLVLAGGLLRTGLAGWVGLVSAAAAAAALVSVMGIVGPVLWFVVIWVTALPLALAIGLADVLSRLLAPARRAPRHAREREAGRRPAPAAALVGAALALAAVVAAGFLTPLQTSRTRAVENSAGVAALTRLVTPALPVQAAGPADRVVVDIDAGWLAGAGLVRHLQLAGWQVSVNEQYLFVFGRGYAEHGPAAARVLLRAPGTSAAGRLLGTVPTEEGPLAVFLS